MRVVQLDSVNVVSRAHYLPFFSRLGPYDRAALDRWLWQSGEMFEYWAHEASLVPIELRPLLTHRMTGGWHWPSVDRMLAKHGETVHRTLEIIRENGPTRVGDLDHHERTGESWWGWSNAKLALEYLFLTGQVTASSRPAFQRVYDLPERVHPHAIELGALEADAAKVELLALGAAAHGIGTVHDFADYFRLKIRDARRALGVLVERGDVEEVAVDGWGAPAYVHADAARPRKLHTRALLAPFDPVVWFRDRAERLFDFHYRIEIYTPAQKRVHGYYVLPFLLDDRLVGRVDLKAERKDRRLLVRGAFGEPEIDEARTAVELAAELREMAIWLDLDDIVVSDNGDLASRLTAAVKDT